jgi:hypothetical protein
MDYAGLQASVLRWAARETDASLIAELPELIALTTAMFNHGQDGMVPAIRVREMERLVSIEGASGYYPLPADYLEYLTLKSGSDSDCCGRDVPFEIDRQYIRPYHCDFSYGDLQLTYYAKIDDIVTVEDHTNWLLQKQPNAYLHGTLLQVAMFIRDNTLFQRSAALLKAIIDGLAAEDMMAKYARPRVRINGIVRNMSGISHIHPGTGGDGGSLVPGEGYSFLEIDSSLVEVQEP